MEDALSSIRFTVWINDYEKYENVRLIAYEQGAVAFEDENGKCHLFVGYSAHFVES